MDIESQTAFKIFLYHLTPEIYKKKKKKSSFVIALSLNLCCFSYMKKKQNKIYHEKKSL